MATTRSAQVTHAPHTQDASEKHLEKLEQLGHLLDNSIRIPIIGYRIGYDALLGLIPGAGDLIGLLLSTYIILQSARLGLPRSTVFRMVANVGLETLAGSVPVLGDVIDAGWKANLRNIRMARSHFEAQPALARKANKRFFGLTVITVVLLLIGFLALSLYLLSRLLQLASP